MFILGSQSPDINTQLIIKSSNLNVVHLFQYAIGNVKLKTIALTLKSNIYKILGKLFVIKDLHLCTIVNSAINYKRF